MNHQLLVIEKTQIGNQVVNSVSAHELYVGLGLAKSAWSRWSVNNIEKNEFFTENVDWRGFNRESNGNETKDYAISLEFAKHIAMQAKTEKSHEYRQYMIECENRSQNQLALPDFTNPAEAARAWASEYEQKMVALQKIEADRPKVEFAERVRNMQGACEVGKFAKTVGIGRNKFFKMMREDGILMAGNMPYQQYIDRGLFIVIELTPYTDNEGKDHPTFKTMITGKGQVWLEKKYRPADSRA